MKSRFRILPQAAVALILLSSTLVHSQDWVHTGTNLGQDRIRLAAAEAKDDFVGESMRDGANGILRSDVGVLLAEDLWADGIARVKEPTLNGEMSA